MDKNAWGGEVQTETKYNLVGLIVAAEEHNPLLRAAQEQANQARALELQSASIVT